MDNLASQLPTTEGRSSALAGALGSASVFYADEYVTLYHGDSREILPTLPDVDLVLTDPPYGVDKAEWDDRLPLDIIAQAAGKCSVMGVMPGISNFLALPYDLPPLAYKWTLSVFVDNGMTRSPLGFSNWIGCMIYARDGVKLHGMHQDATRISIGGDKVDHPSPKPQQAITWMLSRLPGQTVLDPFAGSGTTGRAAKDLRRKCILIEREKRFCELIARNLAQEVLPLG